MKNNAVLLFLVIALSGCASAQIDVTETDVALTCKASYVSLFKDLSGVRMRACDASGSADNSESRLSNAMLQALIRGMAGQ